MVIEKPTANSVLLEFRSITMVVILSHPRTPEGGRESPVYLLASKYGLTNENPLNWPWFIDCKRSLSVGVNRGGSIVKSGSKLLVSLGER